MAKFGARYSRWAPWAKDFNDTDANKLPTYDKVVDIGQLNKANESLNFSEGSMYGDDQIALYKKNFKDGTLDVESVFIPLSAAASMFGAACDENGGLSHGDDDKAPYGGYGCITHHASKTKTYFQAVFYPKVKATPTAEAYETRGDNINFAADKLSYHIESPVCRKYKVIKDFDTEAAATAYIDGLFAGTATAPGLPAVAAAE